MPKYSPEFIERVRQANPIVDLIGEYLSLKKSGKNYKACCPFHNEKTPSFTITSNKEIFKCFGCGKGGNVFSFMMEYDGLSFPEAIEFLANRAAIPIESEHGSPDAMKMSLKRQQQKQKLYSICQLALNYFERMLATPQGKDAREYIKNRNISEEAQRAFRLGYAPNQWDGFLKHARAEGFNDDDLVTAGLIVQNENDKFYDRFRDRLIFPIWDLAGNAIAFGGRIMSDEQPKYLNSPESIIYYKSKILYPINLTKRAIKQKQTAILCEGYMDALTLAQYGFTNTVAACGTSLTDDQAHLLKRFANKVIIAYDGDAAGQDASLRSISVLADQKLDLYIAPLAGGEDPDSYIKKNGKESFQELLDQAQPFFPFLMNRLALNIDCRTPHGQQQFCDKIFPLLTKFTGQIIIDGYLDQVAEFLSLDSARVMRAFKDFSPNNNTTKRIIEKKQAPQRIKISKTEECFIAIICRYNEALEYAAKHLDISYIENNVAHQIVAKMFAAVNDKSWLNTEAFLNEISDEHADIITSALTKIPDLEVDDEDDANWKKGICDCIKSLHIYSCDIEINRLKEELNSLTDMNAMQDIMKRINSYQILKRKQNRITKLDFNKKKD